MLPLRPKMDLGTKAIKRYSAFPKAPALLEPHHQIVLCHIVGWGVLPICREESVYSTATADWANRPSDQVRAKVVCYKSLTSLSPDQWLLNHQGSVLAPYGAPPTANWWLHGGGVVLPLCRGAIGVFYSPSLRGGRLLEHNRYNYSGSEWICE